MTHSSSATRREPDAFEAGVLSHLDVMYGVAMRLTKDPALAEDLVQDTVVKAMRARHQFATGTNLKAWLLRIERNTFINRHRRGGLERDVLEGPTARGMADRWTGSATMQAMRDPERQAFMPLIERQIQAALDKLPESFRLVILLSDLEGLSYKEIADVMGCPVGTVMSRLHRARRLLQADLHEHALLLGIISQTDDEDEPRRAVVNDPGEPVDLQNYRARSKK